MWFSFFKSEAHAVKIYQMLLPKIMVVEKADGTLEDKEKETKGENN